MRLDSLKLPSPVAGSITTSDFKATDELTCKQVPFELLNRRQNLSTERTTSITPLVLDPTREATTAKRVLTVPHDWVSEDIFTDGAEELFIDGRCFYEVALYFNFSLLSSFIVLMRLVVAAVASLLLFCLLSGLFTIFLFFCC